MKKNTNNLLFNTKTRLKHTFCKKLRNNSLFGKKTLFVWEGNVGQLNSQKISPLYITSCSKFNIHVHAFYKTSFKTKTKSFERIY